VDILYETSRVESKVRGILGTECSVDDGKLGTECITVRCTKVREFGHAGAGSRAQVRMMGVIGDREKLSVP